MNLLNGRIITKDKILKLSAIIKAKEQKSADTGFSILIFTYTRLLRLLPTAEKTTKKERLRSNTQPLPISAFRLNFSIS